jgi:hypothetical protein
MLDGTARFSNGGIELVTCESTPRKSGIQRNVGNAGFGYLASKA